MIKALISIGNPDTKYKKTRHNAGHLVMDRIISNLNVATKTDWNLNCEIAIANLVENKYSELLTKVFETCEKRVIIAKSLTYMNESGESVSKLAKFYKLNPEELMIFHDDLDISLGNYKIAQTKGPKVHNGIISIERYLKSKNFFRTRIGIENRGRENKMTGYDYVLSNFTKKELDIINSL